jgi:antitoxin (DNA-binding transcriptional repressor) of toxin-antitoxin stability system
MIVGMHEAKTQLSKLVKMALEGEEILLASRGDVLVRLVPVGAAKRELGWLVGQGGLKPGWEQDEGLFEDYDGDPLSEARR